MTSMLIRETLTPNPITHTNDGGAKCKFTLTTLVVKVNLIRLVTFVNKAPFLLFFLNPAAVYIYARPDS